MARLILLTQERGDGKNGAVLRGIRASSGEVVVVLDVDCHVTRSWLTELVDGLESGPFDAVNGFARPTGEMNSVKLRYVAQQTWNSRKRSGFFGGASIAFRRKLLEKLGPEMLFDPISHGAEDLLLYRRLVECGARVGYVPEAVVYTPRPGSYHGFIADSMRFNGFSFRHAYAGRFKKSEQFVRSLLVLLSAGVTLCMIANLGYVALIGQTFLPAAFVTPTALLVAVAFAAIACATVVRVLQFCWLGLDRNRTRYFPAFLLLDLLYHFSLVAAFIYGSVVQEYPEIHFKGAREGA